MITASPFDSSQLNDMPNNIRFPPGLGWSDIISGGNVGMVLDPGDVIIKIPVREQDQPFIEVEKQVYERLANEHSLVLRYHGPSSNGLLLQRVSQGSVRQFLRANGPQPLAVQVRWVRQAVESIAFIHSKEILHADICCNNFFLDDNLDIKLGDFAGSSIDGCRSLVFYQTSHAHPEIKLSATSELFALGSTMYEIITGVPPYSDLAIEDIEDAYRREDFPELPQHKFGELINKCWHREYSSVDELLQEVIPKSN